MNDNKQVGSKMFYSISEVSQMLAVPASTLRYWEKELPSVSPRKSQGGTRKYTPADIEELRLIHRLVKEEGHTIEGVRKLLRTRRNSEVSKQEALQRLQDIKTELLAMIAEIEQVSTVK